MRSRLSDIALRRFVNALKQSANEAIAYEATSLSSAAEVSAAGVVDEHRDKRQFVHGVGPLYVAKTRNASQYVAWSEIEGRPDLSELDVDAGTLELSAHQIVDGVFGIGRLPVAAAGVNTPDAVVRADDPRLSVKIITKLVGQALIPGDFVTLYDDGGTEKCKPAIATTGNTAVGYVSEGYGVGQTATIYPAGLNEVVFLPGLTATAINRTVYLSGTSAGKVTLTPPGGFIIQPLGQVTRIVSSTLAEVLVRWTLRIHNASPLGPEVSNADYLNEQPGSYYCDRANHTGQQPASTISDLEATMRAYLSNPIEFHEGSAPPPAPGKAHLFLRRTNGTQELCVVGESGTIHVLQVLT